MSKISQLTEDATPTHDDLIETATDPAGTPLSRRAKLSSVFFAFQQWIFGSDAGSTDTYVVTLSPVPVAYVTGYHYRFKANTVNTGACTVNFNGLGARTIKKHRDQDLADGDIEAGQWVDLVYDGTNMQMQSQLGNSPAGGTGGAGDVVGPGLATDKAVVRYDTTTGKLIQDSVVIVSDAGVITVPETAAPSTPAAGTVHIYAKADGLLYSKDDAGMETLVSGGTGGGGSIAPLVIESANHVSQRNSTNAQTFEIWKDYPGDPGQRLKIHTANDAGGSPRWMIEGAANPFNAVQLPAIANGGNAVVFQDGSMFPSVGVGVTSTVGKSTARFHQFFAWNFLNIRQGSAFDWTGVFWEASSRIISYGNGHISIDGSSDNATGSRLLFGTAVATAPMLKRNGAVLEAKLADDSSYAAVVAGSIRTNPLAFASLPTGMEGMLVTVTDSSTTTWGATISGGGANRVLAYFNGTNWTVAAV